MLAESLSHQAEVEAAWESLRRVHDPCSISLGYPLNLVDMGLVERVEVEDGTLLVELCLTEPSCMFGMQIATLAETELGRDLGPERPVTVRVVPPPPGEIWTEERMNPEARQALRAHRTTTTAVGMPTRKKETL